MTKPQIADFFSHSKLVFDCSKRCSTPEKPGIYLSGIPFDDSASFRKGTRFGPDAIRQASYQLETFSPYCDSDLEDHQIFDLGNCKIKSIGQQKKRYQMMSDVVTQGLKKQAKFLTIGGDHSISIAPIWGYQQHYSNLTIIHLDAHADLRPSYQNNPHSHASIMARVIEGKSNLIQYGIRSGTREEFTQMESMNSLFHSQKDFFAAVEQCDNPIYLSLDLDYFDPSIIAGTGTPEAGGENFLSLISLLQILQKKDFVGADVTELAPKIDKSGNSTIIASKVIREILLCLALSSR